MLVFTLRMIIADIQKVFRGYWIIIYFGLVVFIICAPFYTNNTGSLSYCIYIIFFFLAPRITKVFYVLPMGDKVIRKYLHLRSFLLMIFFLVVGGIVTLSSQKWPVPHLEHGWIRMLVYIQIIMYLEITVVFVRRKLCIPAVILVTILICINFVNVFLNNFHVQIRISIACMIVSAIHVYLTTRKLKLVNYIEPVYDIYKNGKQKSKK